MRRVVGDAAGLTVKAQLRQAARHLGYPDDDWRVREAWYGRAGSWSAAVVDDLRRRGVVARERGNTSSLARRLRELRAGLARIDRELAGMEAEIAALVPVSGGEGVADA